MPPVIWVPYKPTCPRCGAKAGTGKGNRMGAEPCRQPSGRRTFRAHCERYEQTAIDINVAMFEKECGCVVTEPDKQMVRACAKHTVEIKAALDKIIGIFNIKGDA